MITIYLYIERVIVLLGIAMLFACDRQHEERNLRVTPAPVEVVDNLCKARQALNASRMEQYIADSFFSENDDGTHKLYERSLAARICEWEKGMHTNWAYEILGTDHNVVTVLLKEWNDYYRLSGLGHGIQVTQYFVSDGKIQKSVSKLFITESGSQCEAYRQFTGWLFSRPGLKEPALISPDSSLIFDGDSAPRMLYWLEKWQEHEVGL